jgi:hypothetical protein
MSVENLDEIAQQIYCSPVRDPGTIQLGLDENFDQTDGSPQDNAALLFEMLMAMMLSGIKAKYNIAPSKLNVDQFDLVRRYNLSYGVIMHIQTDSLSSPPEVDMSEDGTSLEHYRERFYDFDRSVWHQISFSLARVHYGVVEN